MQFALAIDGQSESGWIDPDLRRVKQVDAFPALFEANRVPSDRVLNAAVEWPGGHPSGPFDPRLVDGSEKVLPAHAGFGRNQDYRGVLQKFDPVGELLAHLRRGLAEGLRKVPFIHCNHHGVTFYLRFLEARKSGNLFVEKNVDAAHLHPCPKCGQPTSTYDFCSFCRLIEKAATQTVN